MKTITSYLSATAFALTLAPSLGAQVFTETFTSALKASNGAAEATLGTGGGGYSYDGNYGTWIYNAGNMGIDDPAEGNGDGVGSGNAISSVGEARLQDWRGGNARATSVILDGALFTDATTYTVSFDVIGDASGNDAGRYWLAEVGGYDNSGSNYVQADGTHAGWGGGQKPFTGFGAAFVTYLADSVDNGVLIEGENVAGTTTTSFNFTYSAGTDIAFAVGTYNNIFAIDNVQIVEAVPEPSVFGLLAGCLALLAVSRRRR